MPLKIVLATDGSEYSSMATGMLKAFRLPSQSEVTVMTVVPEQTFLGGITLHMFRGNASSRELARKAQEQKAAEMLKGPSGALEASGVKVNTLVRWGSPAEQIIKHARGTQADLIAIGAKGAGDSPRFPLGRVAYKVMKYAESSVLLAREETPSIRRVLLATDGSRHSESAADFLLDLPLPRRSQVFIATSLESHVAALLRMPTLDLDTNQKILSELRVAEERAAQDLMSKTKKQFQEKGYDTESLVLRGDAAEEIMLAARTLNPDLLVMGAKGLTGMETFLLGSVAHRVARHSRYSVLIVRTPQHHSRG